MDSIPERSVPVRVCGGGAVDCVPGELERVHRLPRGHDAALTQRRDRHRSSLVALQQCQNALQLTIPCTLRLGPTGARGGCARGHGLAVARDTVPDWSLSNSARTRSSSRSPALCGWDRLALGVVALVVMSLQ